MRRNSLWLAFAMGLVGLGVLANWLWFPTDRSPKGSYYRVAIAVNRDQPQDLFPYIETEAQHAAFSIGHYSREARDRVRQVYPEPARTEELTRLGPLADVEPGPGVFAHYAELHGWVGRLRRDLSGVASVEIEGERATVQTARGTRYPFRRRDTGMWGLTLFTAQLVADAEKAARDLSQIQAAAKDYEAAKRR